MAKQYKSDRVRLAFEQYANQHKGKREEIRAKDINSGVEDILGEPLGGWCVSDFAESETTKSRSKYNKTLFKRIERGKYIVL